MNFTSLRRNNDFRRLYAKGKSVAGAHMAIYTQHSRQPITRLGLTVSTKLGGAVVRNRVRRRLREIFRTLPVRAGLDIVIVARARAVGAPFSVLHREMTNLLAKLSLLQPPDGEDGM